MRVGDRPLAQAHAALERESGVISPVMTSRFYLVTEARGGRIISFQGSYHGQTSLSADGGP